MGKINTNVKFEKIDGEGKTFEEMQELANQMNAKTLNDLKEKEGE